VVPSFVIGLLGYALAAAISRSFLIVPIISAVGAVAIWLLFVFGYNLLRAPVLLHNEVANERDGS
jgi:hypothetical protein